MSLEGLGNLIPLVISASRYLIILLMVIYTVQCYTVFGRRSVLAKRYVFLRQNVSMFCIHFIAFLTMFLDQMNFQVLVFYGAQLVYLLAALILLTALYPRSSRLLINNMLMLITIGLIMITRLSFDSAVRQFKIVAAGTAAALLIPVIVRKVLGLTRLAWAYTFVGIGLLGLVLVAARVTNGAKLNISVGGFAFQPSEFVKIIYVFAIAGLLTQARDMKRIVIATVLAAIHVLILVVSKDLGSALIFFITYLAMLFTATHNPFLVLFGLGAGALSSVAAYFIFSHIRVRVSIWLDPFADYAQTGYQISQSLFSIAAGRWFGTGLGQGSPGAIPFVQQDMMFSAICEELGAIFGICLILVCMNVFIMFINIAMKLTNRFYRLVALGLGTTYAVQVFLTIGGGIKLIPLTGVTLPLVSYGGSSALSTIVMFAIVQGLYMLRRDEVTGDEKQRRKEEEEYDYREGDRPGYGVGPGEYGRGGYDPGEYDPAEYDPAGSGRRRRQYDPYEEREESFYQPEDFFR